MFWAAIADGKTGASDNCKMTLGGREEKLQNLNLSPLLDGSYLGGSLGAC